MLSLNEELLTDFLDAKELEGLSKATLTQYKFNISKLLNSQEKELKDITTADIRKYLADYKRARGVTNVTLDNMRRNFASFFSWLHNEGKINKNPAAAVNKIKQEKVIKKPFTDEEIEILRENCKNLRERAVVEVLYSTGIRVGELVGLNKQDIDWNKRCAIVFGKGSKEREVYFNVKSEMALKKYIDSRNDENEALFVGLLPPYNRLKTSSIEASLRALGKRCDIICHPHKFRRTCATTLLNKGMPIQEVSRVLGHAKLETTMIYCTIDQEMVATNHKKYMN